MKLRNTCGILALSVFLAGAAPATQPRTTTAHAVVAVWSSLNWQPSNQTRDADALKAELIREIAGKAANTLGVAPEMLQEYIGIGLRFDRGATDASSGENLLDIRVTLDDKAHASAGELMDQIVAALPAVIDHLQRSDLEDQLQAAFDSEVAQDALRSLKIIDPSPSTIHTLALSLDQQNQQLILDVAALAAERQALTNNLDRLSQQAHQKAESDPIAQELETIVKLKQQKLDALQNLRQKGLASDADVADAASSAAEARVQYLERREAVTRDWGGDNLADLQKQLIAADVNLDQDRARLDAIQKESDTLTSAQQLLSQIPRAESGFLAQKPMSAQISQELNNIPKPAVRVIGPAANP